MIESILQKDKELFLFLNSLGNEQWDGFWMLMTNAFISVPLYLCLAFLFYKKIGVKKTVLFFLLLILIVTTSDQLSQLFKYGFKRLRPCHDEEISSLTRLVKASCGGRYSYFSAHASTGMALAVYFGFMLKVNYKKLIFFLLCLASVIGYSRIYIGVHYPLDIATGFIFGAIIGYVFYKLYTIVALKFIKTEF